MKLLASTLFAILILAGTPVLAHGNEAVDSNGHTAREEAEGQALWDKLQSKQIACADLSADDFAALGEYFMGQMLGASHESMNNMMAGMMGQDGEKEMHAVMGKRFSGCDSSASFSGEARGFMPMMQMMSSRMMGDWSSPLGFNQTKNSMMWNFGGGPMGWGAFGLGGIFGVLVWVLLILAITALVIWIRKQIK